MLDASTSADPVAEVIEMTKGGVHHAFEAIGLKQTAEQAFAMLRRGDTANISGMIPVGPRSNSSAPTSWRRSASRAR